MRVRLFACQMAREYDTSRVLDMCGRFVAWVDCGFPWIGIIGACGMMFRLQHGVGAICGLIVAAIAICRLFTVAEQPAGDMKQTEPVMQVPAAANAPVEPAPSVPAAQAAVPEKCVATERQRLPLSPAFCFPVQARSGAQVVTPEMDGDGYYDAQAFGVNRHLGEDWNGEGGGNSDLGKPVYAVGNGLVVLAEDIGPGWGNVVIIRHALPDGRLVESLYGHLEVLRVEEGAIVSMGQVIGAIGTGRSPRNSTKVYMAHLHFEIRLESCPCWGLPGPGYRDDASGWVAPSAFINASRAGG